MMEKFRTFSVGLNFKLYFEKVVEVFSISNSSK